MIAVAPTDLDWFRQLREAGSSEEINFWTPTPWNVRQLGRGDRFYFLLKAPIRKIGGYGEFVAYQNLRVSEAWGRFGKNNGVRSLEELRSRTMNYAGKRSQQDASAGDPEIGCIILSNSTFLPEGQYVAPEDMGLDFPDQVVKLKYFDPDPPFPVQSVIHQSEVPMLKVLEEEGSIDAANKRFKERLTERFDRSGPLSLGFQGGKRDAEVWHREDLDLWLCFEVSPDRYWNAFGTGNPFETPNLPIVVEINPPRGGINRRLGGAFAVDAKGTISVVHRGRVGGGRPGIGKEEFMRVYPGPKATLADGDQEAEVIVIGRVEDPEFPQQVASFVHSVAEFKAEQTIDGAGDARVWWVNQGKTFDAEKAGGFLWAPQKTQSGSTVQHHRNVSLLRPGQCVIHYASGAIQALGTVTNPPKEEKRPQQLPEAYWEEEGWLAGIQYHHLETPIRLNEIPVELRSADAGPFDMVGAIKQGYLFELGATQAAQLKMRFEDRWPVDSTWGQTAVDDSALHLLLKWNPSHAADTVERHLNLARSRGSVWWGKFGSGRTSQAKIDRIRSQIDDGMPTHAFLYKRGETWRTSVVGITKDAEEVGDADIPGYYEKEDCSLFIRLADFEKLEPDWPLENLVLASSLDPARVPGALGNQQNPLWVHVLSRRTPHPPAPLPRTQDLSYEWLEEKTLWTREALEELVESIRTTSPQVVLAGPPGTGKTWVAKHVARFLTQDHPLATRTVQFHPSYGYEEFIEGLRPIVKDGGVSFEQTPGVILQMVEEIEHEDAVHVLVIDEMNRANLPRVFGELMYLFEYRDEEESIDLQYTRDFSLPRNLRFIGTMNTADRSIRSIDLALRRRFDVFECPPDSGILVRFYKSGRCRNEVENLIEGFEALNTRLQEELDRHHTIGQTFFFAPQLTRGRMKKIWERKLGPLIEEYFFDQPDLAAEFRFDEFWPEK